ncbi:isoprenoid synthase domain-containing protein [Penicillium malachiteum]|uniref:isoprenoid synthase domain-containing protein n=1 Tax=Penicillium malachiteum TaxID=1324776 RepID=UPI002549B8E5|nr:isoprenoid synthase domain-containing protein [Penicillium malachiteum]KAJ5726014.1 isoprenoid synthase domain-containing protein [Penicillium malachiteum]
MIIRTCEALHRPRTNVSLMISQRPENQILYSILRQRSEDIAVKQRAVDHIQSTGSFHYCEQRIALLIQEAREATTSIMMMADTTLGCQMEGILNSLGTL